MKNDEQKQAEMYSCADIAISGGCGPSCPVYVGGGCGMSITATLTEDQKSEFIKKHGNVGVLFEWEYEVQELTSAVTHQRRDMKSIQVSDEDYETLMGLSKELQVQENDRQAFPYFWSPRSTMKVQGCDNGEKVYFLDDRTKTAQEVFESDDELRESFLKDCALNLETSFEEIEKRHEGEWEDYIKNMTEYSVVYEKEEEVTDNNFSLFKQDVKEYIYRNKHHLGKNPHAFANTIVRMTRMEKLIKCLYRINVQPEEITNQEALCYRNR